MQMSEIGVQQEKNYKALQRILRRAAWVLAKTQEPWRHPDASTLEGRYPLARAVLKNAIGKLRDGIELEESDKVQLMLINLIIDILTVEMEHQDSQKAQGKPILSLGELPLFESIPGPALTIPDCPPHCCR
jgi:hypothetical protein